MNHSTKFTISLPAGEFQDLESICKKRGLSRSRFILEAIRLWKETKRKEKNARIYVEGYQRMPETSGHSEAWEKASVDSFSHEDW
ncbi:MAG: hypothetical protein NTU60_10565 [Candidatus Aminicenantes bacterium]|nr:hypothetical protein [Candidatus Aminicenantes bacterium]